MAPITRREQLELDELLGDIYKGIETLPDKSLHGGELVTSSSYDIVKSPTDSASRSIKSQQQQQPRVIGHAYVRQYELPGTSPLVQQHKRELRSQEGATSSHSYNSTTSSKRSNVKSPTGGQQQKSLASFLNANPVGGSATPENKRRVRIVDPDSSSRQQALKQTNFDSQYQVRDDHHDDDDDDDHNEEEYALNDYYNETSYAPGQRQQQRGGANSKKQKKHPEKVKYVNTNKFIYHQERNPDDEPLDDLSDLDGGRILINRQLDNNPDDDDDIDGVTRVEYYHTSWLDRQLGRASKRRSSKELNERQVKEKAMIEELKRNLKSGAITLRQSLKGGNNKKAPSKPSDYFADDQFLDSYHNDYDDDDNNNNNNNNNNKHYNTTKTHTKYTTRDLKSSNKHKHHQPSEHRLRDSSSKVIGSGLATIPRNYHHHQKTPQEQQQQQQDTKKPTSGYQFNQFDSVYQSSTYDPYTQQPQAQQLQQQLPMQTPYYQGNNQSIASGQYSRTLPPKKTTTQEQQPHQLLQSHYRGQLRDKTNYGTLLNSSPRPSPLPTQGPVAPQSQQRQQPSNTTNSSASNQADKMRFTGYNNSNNSNNNNQNHNNCASPSQQNRPKSPVQQQLQASTTISGIPSATEVVRSALSRSSSQISLNQLNKTINLLPNSPPAASPMTPTQQLQAASPSLSPSPQPASSSRCTPSQQQQQQQQPYSSKTLGHHPSHHHQASQQHLPGQIMLHGTRTVGRPPQQQQQQPASSTAAGSTQQQQQQQQPVYANPHASFIQHRLEQQMKQPNRNVASIREFNELDSLLRSLGQSTAPYGGGPRGAGVGMSSTSTPDLGGGASTTTGPATQTHITPGFSSKPAQVSFGGFMPSNQQHQPQQQQQPATRPGQADIYARVQKPQPQHQQQVGAGVTGVAPTGPNPQSFTIDVTDKKYDENCLGRRQRNEALSEFEPPIELVPSMEDYQNISKLNPVKNNYWYKPNMSRDMAICLLKDKPQGTFIVRDSTSFRGAYGLAVKVSKLPKNILANLRSANSSDPSSEYIRHFLIEPTGAGVRLKGYANEPVFDSLPDLIYQHSLTELALPCKLIIPRADIEDPRFNQKQKQFFDEFIASKEQAKHQPYERTSPDGGYRRYPGDVLVHNEHRIIFQ